MDVHAYILIVMNDTRAHVGFRSAFEPSLQDSGGGGSECPKERGGEGSTTKDKGHIYSEVSDR